MTGRSWPGWLLIPTALVAVGCGSADSPPADLGAAAPAVPGRPSAEQPVDVGPPIPQDPARMQKHRRAKLEWNRSTLVGAYEKVGRKDPRWDGPAREALELAARMFGEATDPEVTMPDVDRKARAAIDAGCDDPLLVYLHNRCMSGPEAPGKEEMIGRMRSSAEGLATSRYPAIRRAVAHRWAGVSALSTDSPGGESWNQAERQFDAALALLPESAAQDERGEFWEDQWLTCLHAMVDGYRQLGLAAPAAYERIDSRLETIPELKLIQLLFRGRFWVLYGWEARTNAFAGFVPPGGFEALEERLGIARTAYEEAWRLRPDDARAASHLVDIEKSIGGDRATMELWFDRAMKADGDHTSACFSKLDWLDPKWHGSTEEMLAFGRACGNTKNWHAGITLLACDAYFRHYAGLVSGERIAFSQNRQVWAEMKSIFDEYLRHRPGRTAVRSKYAALAYFFHDNRTAHAQFLILGDDLTTWTDFPVTPMESLNRIRETVSQVVTGKPFQGGGTATPGETEAKSPE